MTIWKHAEYADARAFNNDACFPQFARIFSPNYSPDSGLCFFCKTEMEPEEIDDCWEFGPEDYVRGHLPAVESMLSYGLAPMESLEVSGKVSDSFQHLYVCRNCGWWFVAHTAMLRASRSTQIWSLTMASAGSLRKLPLDKPSEEPMTDLCRYLAARYSGRHTMHPRNLEMIVASVYRHAGYETILTAYGNDGGIDVILVGPNQQKIGIQIKRRKRSIEVEHIRSFLGALTLGNYTKGIFISTSGFQKGAINAAATCKQQYIPIALIDSDRFAEALKLANMSTEFSLSDCGFDPKNPPAMHPIEDLHLNSL